jgi:hypothetical protein
VPSAPKQEEIMRVRATRDFRANVDGFVQDFAAGQELSGHTASYLHSTGAPVEAVDEPEADQTAARPGVRDAKDAWVGYAIAQGLPRDEAEQLTKDQLVERFKDN